MYESFHFLASGHFFDSDFKVSKRVLLNFSFWSFNCTSEILGFFVCFGVSVKFLILEYWFCCVSILKMKSFLLFLCCG